jgi:cell division protein FtsQ
MKFFWNKSATSPSRRHAKFRVQRLKKFGVIGGVAATVIALGIYAHVNGSFTRAGAWVSTTTLQTTQDLGFSVGEILVTGRQHIAQEDILTHLNIRQGQAMFSIDLDATRETLERISWVERAVVSRRLPDKIVVSITERTPVALWQYKQNISLIDRDGTVLTASGLDAWQHLPLIVGEDAPQHAMELMGLLKAEPAIERQLASAVRIGNRRWDLHLKNGIVVKLPEQNTGLALSRLIAQQKKNDIFNRNLVAVDLRIPERFVVEQKAAPEDAGTKKSI